MSHKLLSMEHTVTEWHYVSGRKREDPFNEIELDAVIKHKDGDSWRVPAFWAGGQEWRIRFRPPKPGIYEPRTSCSDESDSDFHGVRSTLEVSANDNPNPLYTHGPLQVAQSQRTFQYADGSAFFWLADTLWMGLCNRMSWPEDFQKFTADRVAKGFNVIQIVAGLYPDMPGFDERGLNEAGFPWEKDYARINPSYFDMADLRIAWLVRSGLTACIVGCWGYYLPLLGMKKMKQHWRNLIARWGAYPVVWCLAGEAAMPYYLSEDKERDSQRQVEGWTEMCRYVRETDPYTNIITVHPNEIGRNQVVDDSVLDFDMLQTGHNGYASVSNTVSKVLSERERKPPMPVILAEVNYEGIIHSTQAEIQRLTFWASILSGAAGHTYGANGIWQINTKDKPYGASPHGGTWGNTPWEEAYQLPGSQQLGLARQLLERYDWWRFEPHQEWVSPSGNEKNVNAPFAAGISKEVRIIYFYEPTYPWFEKPIHVINIEPGTKYRAFFWDPRNAEEHDLGAVEADESGSWEVPVQPTFDDWVVVLEVSGN